MSCYSTDDGFMPATAGGTVPSLREWNDDLAPVVATPDSDALLRIASRLGRFGAWAITVPDLTVTWSDEVRAIHEVPSGYVPDLDSAIDFYPHEYRRSITEAFGRCIADGTPYDLELQLITARGRRLWVRAIGEAEFDDAGCVRRVNGAFQDISDLRLADEKSRQLAEQLTETVESITDAFITVDRAWRFTYINGPGECLLQSTRAELLGRNLWDVFPEARASRFDDEYSRAMNEHVAVEFEQYYAPLRIWVQVRAYPSAQGITIYARDISERKLAERKLHESEERYRLLFDRNPHPTWVFDQETLAFLAVNEAAIRHYGYSREEFLQMTIKDIRPPEDVPALVRSIREHYERHAERLLLGTVKQRKKNGTVIDVEVAASNFVFSGRAACLVLAIDVTEKRRIEQEFLRAQRMESIGTLAGGIAHDVNNLLMPMTMGVSLLRRDHPTERGLRVLDNIETSVSRTKALVQQLLSFARGADGTRIPLQISEVIREVEAIVKSTFPKDISLRLYERPDLWWIDGDPTQVHQVILNLCVNARDAMPKGGMLTIATKNVEIDEFLASIHRDLRAGPHVLIEVADQGSGMSPETIERIFDPFFTTKPKGHGTGLGLSTVAAIVRGHNGSILTYSEPGKGTMFKIYIPARAAVNDDCAVADDTVSEQLRGAGELILVVDDETSVLGITQMTLEGFGYRVVTARDGAEAVALYATHRQEIAAVITDMMMPVMDGSGLIAALRRLSTSVPIIAASGLHDDPRLLTTTSGDVQDFLQKPFAAPDLLRSLGRLLKKEQ
ncbi:MAG TPA: PAS domain S-box protein [Thermoanaerobaculia bacterium]